MQMTNTRIGLPTMRRLIALTLFCLATGSSLFAQSDTPKKQTVLRISPQTTRITEPLDERGFVDYVKAVDQMASRGVTTENNFEVVLRRVLGPEEIPEVMRKEYYQRLGIAISRANFFISYSDFRKLDNKPSSLTDFNRGYEAPWTADDLPHLARWLHSVDGKLDTLVSGSKRARYYTPYLAGLPGDSEEYPRMISMLLPSVQGHREVARSLRIRANLNISEGDLEAAWNDVMAIYRISRLTAQGITLIEALVGIAIDGMAFETTLEILNSRALTDNQARRFLVDLKQLPRPTPMAKKLDIGERFMGLDALQTLARQPDLLKTLQLIKELAGVALPAPAVAGNDRSEFGNGTTLVVVQEKGNGPAPAPGIDWNVTAVLLNGWYDRLVAAAREGDFQQRRQLFAKIDIDIKQLTMNASSASAALLKILKGKPDQQVGRMIGEVLVTLLIPVINAVSQAEQEQLTRMDVLRLAFAAEVHRRELGVFPAELSKLVPEFLDQIPRDRMSGNPLRYNVVNQNMILYSLGRNGRDDRGRGYGDDSDDNPQGWDDIVVRISGQRSSD